MQQALRGLFECWGLPERIRVDNGAPWATWTDVPPALVLWWLGLGIEPLWNHPHCPKENCFVERCNGLIDSWGEPSRCPDYAAWEAKLTWLSRMQREVYPGERGCSRLAAYPQLAENPRPFSPAREAATFDLGRVRAYLAEGRWPRIVSKIGQITLYGKPYRVGRQWSRREVWVRYAPEASAWVIETDNNDEIVRHPAEQISVEKIRALQVANPRPPSKKKQPRQNLPAHGATELYSA